MKTTYLDKLEDEILIYGSEGAKRVISFLKQFGKNLSEPQSSLKKIIRWDGFPSIVCGIDPSNNTFFVGTEYVFSEYESKICYTENDVDLFYGSTDKLNKILKLCLKYLPKLNIKGVVKGDILYTDNKKIRLIGGQKSIIFKSNSTTYVIPSSCLLYDKVKNTKLGITFNTRYSGTSLKSMVSNTMMDINDISENFNVYVADTKINDVTGSASFTKIELIRYNNALKKLETSLKQSSRFLGIIGNNKESEKIMANVFKSFFSTYIRGNNKIKNARDVSKDFYDYYSTLLDKEISSKNVQRIKDKYLKLKNDGLKFILRNQKSIYMAIKSYMDLQIIKSIITKQLQKIKDTGVFIETESGYKVLSNSKFVAIRSGRVLKLIDSLELNKVKITNKNWNKK